MEYPHSAYNAILAYASLSYRTISIIIHKYLKLRKVVGLDVLYTKPIFGAKTLSI